MQLAPVENLPVELLEMVLEIIEDDTLKACSLVCHFWRKVALRYLFMFIVNRSARSFEDLLHFLRDHPHVAEHINVLTLTGPKCDADALHIPSMRQPYNSGNCAMPAQRRRSAVEACPNHRFRYPGGGRVLYRQAQTVAALPETM